MKTKDELISKIENNISRQQLLAHKINIGQKAKIEFKKLDEENVELAKKIIKLTEKEKRPISFRRTYKS